MVCCDDGDIVVTDFDFENQTLQQCTNFDEFLFFVINALGTETLAVQFDTTEPFQQEQGIRTINLSATSPVIYRRFNDEVTSDYFCSPIPPTEPLVAEEFISTAGILSLTTFVDEVDNDGIPSDDEGIEFTEEGFVDTEMSLDTDFDGLLDFMDEDDDGDNVLTFVECGCIDPETNMVNLDLAQDSDGDGIPDYLDEDDDNDGVLTINEDLDQNLNPANDFSDENSQMPDYLNPEVAIVTEITEFRLHSFTRSNIEITASLTNLDLRNTNGEEVIRDITQLFLGTISGSGGTIMVTPDFN